MDFLGVLAPAWGMATLLALAQWVGLRRRRGRLGQPLLRRWLAMGAVGSGVMVVGLVVAGRDGRMATYAALVVAMGLLAAWQSRKDTAG